MAEKETLIFNEYIDRFSHFYKDEEPEINMTLERNPDMVDTVGISDTIAVDNTETENVLDTVLIPDGK